MGDSEESRLGTALRAIVPPATSLTLDRMVAAGRRRERVGWVAGTGGSVAATALVVAVVIGAVGYLGHPQSRHEPAAAPKPALSTSAASNDTARCTIQTLGSVPAAGGVTVTAADTTLRYVIAIGDYHPVRWDNGIPKLLPTPPGSDSSGINVLGVNSRGVVVGNAATKTRVNGLPTNRPFVYRDGASTLLPLPAGFPGGNATAVNDKGDIVGMVIRDTSFVAVLWPAAHPGTVEVLARPRDAHDSEAYAITDAGVIGGTLGDGSTPYVWTSATKGHALHVPGSSGGTVSSIHGHWAGGSVGSATSNTGAISARWDLTTGAIRVFPDYGNGIVAMNAAGDFAISAGVQEPAYLVRASKSPLELPMPTTQLGLYPYPVAMSPDGHLIAGQILASFGTYDVGKSAVIWHC